MGRASACSRRNTASGAATSSGFRRNCEGVPMTQTNRDFRPARCRVNAAWHAVRILPRPAAKHSGPAVHDSAGAINRNSISNCRSTGNGGMLADCRLAAPKQSLAAAMKPVPDLARSREDQDTMKFCRKPIHLESTSAAAFAAILLLPSLAFASATCASDAPPAVAPPAIRRSCAGARPSPPARPSCAGTIAPPAPAEPNRWRPRSPPSR